MKSRPLLQSVLFHGALFGSLAYFVSQDGAHVRGGAGLSGATRTHFEMTVASEISSEPVKKALTPVREGLAVKQEKPTELPTEVKNPNPKQIDENPGTAAESVQSNGSSADAAPGNLGQGGSGSTPSDAVGDSDRTNRLGLYLKKLEQKIQSHLGPSPALDFDRRGRLLLTIRRDGSSEIKVLRTSGDRELDRRALQAAENSRPFEPWETDLTVEVPVLFRAR